MTIQSSFTDSNTVNHGKVPFQFRKLNFLHGVLLRIRIDWDAKKHIILEMALSLAGGGGGILASPQGLTAHRRGPLPWVPVGPMDFFQGSRLLSESPRFQRVPGQRSAKAPGGPLGHAAQIE